MQEAVSALSGAYKGLDAEQSAAIERLLLECVSSAKDTVRLCAVQWADRLFPFHHVPARYICIQVRAAPVASYIIALR